MITVACVLKSGGDYDTAYVSRLQAGVAAHLSMPYRFVCLSDVDVPCERIPLVYNWPSWWAKMELFKLQGVLLYFDLDTIITGNIEPLATRVAGSRHTLIALRDFYRNNLSSGILAWNGDLSSIFDHFYEDYAGGARFKQKPNKTYAFVGQQHFRGDQEWLTHHLKGAGNWLSITMAQDVMPGIYSYKVHVQQTGKVPDDAKIICFHGRPRPAELPANHELRKCWCNEAIPVNS